MYNAIIQSWLSDSIIKVSYPESTQPISRTHWECKYQTDKWQHNAWLMSYCLKQQREDDIKMKIRKNTMRQQYWVDAIEWAQQKLTWEANSAVGTIITARGLPEEDLLNPWSSSSLRRWITGIRYANVFPEPLWSAIMQLCPSRTGLKAIACSDSRFLFPMLNGFWQNKAIISIINVDVTHPKVN